jgi:fatty-acyl-CoA synthase
MAWIRLKEGAQVTPEQLVAYCKGRIATYKIPRYWNFVDGFPMTVTGKIQKFRMRELAVQQLGLATTEGPEPAPPATRELTTA